MTRHTSGPWHIENRYADYVAIEGPENTDGYCPEIAAIELDEHGGGLTPEQEANANLIAAAPEMFAALLAVEWVVDIWGSSVECPWCKIAWLAATPWDRRKHRADCQRESIIASVKRSQ